MLQWAQPLPATGTITATSTAATGQRLLLVRHGESEYNVHYAKHHQDPGDMWDAQLTSKGEEQAAELKPLMSREHVDLVVSSPLTRAIQTGLLASPPGHHVVTALASEHLEASCDIGRPTSELRAAFQTVDFGDLPEVWWYVPEECRHITVQESRRLFAKEGRRESRRDFERRVDLFVAWLSHRQEKVIAIFAHADFFNCFLHRYFGEKEARYSDYWMKNCEVLQLELPEPLLPMAERVPSLPAAALADTEVQVHTPTPSRASHALEALRQDIAQQRPELTPKELRTLAAKQFMALSVEARAELMQAVVL